MVTLRITQWLHFGTTQFYSAMVLLLFQFVPWKIYNLIKAKVQPQSISKKFRKEVKVSFKIPAE